MMQSEKNPLQLMGTPVPTLTTPSPQGKNYKILYNEVTKRLFEQAEAGNRRYLELEAAHEDMKNRFSAMKKMYDDQAAEHDRKMAEKDATIDELKMRLSGKVDPKPVMKMSNADPFVSKLKRGEKGDSKGCQISGCGSINVDLIRCNMCGNLVCEGCSGVKFTKLRPIMSQCTSLYFTCCNCDLLIRDTSSVNVYDTLKEKIKALTEELGGCEKANEKLTLQVQTLDDHQSSLKVLLDEREGSLHEAEAKLVSLEQNSAAGNHHSNGATNIEELINKLFDSIDMNIDALIEKKLAGVLPVAPSQTSSPETGMLFSAVVGSSSGPRNKNRIDA